MFIQQQVLTKESLAEIFSYEESFQTGSLTTYSVEDLLEPIETFKLELWTNAKALLNCNLQNCFGIVQKYLFHFLNINIYPENENKLLFYFLIFEIKDNYKLKFILIDR